MTALCIVLSYPHLNTWLLRIAVVAVIACAVAAPQLQTEPAKFSCLVQHGAVDAAGVK